MVEQERQPKGRGRRLGGRFIVAGALALAPLLAAAQAASEPAANGDAALERAKRDADKVFKWIMIHSDKPRKAAAAADAKPVAAPAPTTATAAAAPRPAPKPKVEDSGIVERVTPIAATAASARPPAPPTAVAALAPKPAAASAAAAPAQLSASDAALALATASAAAGRTASPPMPTAEELEDDDDEPLVLVKQVEPEFSLPTMRKLLKGAVRVRFEVKPDGDVGETEVVKTTSSRLNEAAMRAVAQWKFQPVKRAQHGVVELAFNLE